MHGHEQDSGPGGYAAARLRLLNEKARSGPPRRSALAGLTDEWLAGLFAAGAPGARGVSSSPSAATDARNSPAQRPRPAAAPRRRRHRGRLQARRPPLVPGLGPRPRPRPLRPHPGGGPQDRGEDLKVQLGLLDARHIAGDLGLTTALRTTVLADWRNQAPKRLPALRELCEERAARQGELQYLLEPDLKEAHGGLRDATALRAVAASWLADAPAKDSPRPAAASSTYATPCT